MEEFTVTLEKLYTVAYTKEVKIEAEDNEEAQDKAIQLAEEIEDEVELGEDELEGWTAENPEFIAPDVRSVKDSNNKIVVPPFGELDR